MYHSKKLLHVLVLSLFGSRVAIAQTPSTATVYGVSASQLTLPSTLPSAQAVCGTPTTSYQYEYVAMDASGGITAQSSPSSAIMGCTILNSSAFNIIFVPFVPGSVSCIVYRVAPTGSAGKLPNPIGCGGWAVDNTTTLADTSNPPTINSTGGLSASGAITAQNFLASGTGAGTSDWVAGNPLSLCVQSSGTIHQPCIQPNSFFVQAYGSTITNSFGWTSPGAPNIGFTGPLLIGPATIGTTTPYTSAMSFGTLTNQSNTNLATASTSFSPGDLAEGVTGTSGYDIGDAGIAVTTCGTMACINSPLSALVSAATANTINNSSLAQTWNWALSGSSAVTGFTFGESTASTGSGAKTLLDIQTAVGSSTIPVLITAQGTANGVEMTTAGLLKPIGTGGITATGVPWSGLTAPTASLSFTHPTGDTTSMTWAAQSTNVTDWLWTEGADTGSPASNAFSFIDTTGNTRTGALLNINTVGSSTALPLQVTAQGTTAGVQMTIAGLLQAIGTGGINASEVNGNFYPSGSLTPGGLLCASSSNTIIALTNIPSGEVPFGGTTCPQGSGDFTYSNSTSTLTIGKSGTTTGTLALASSGGGAVNLVSASASSTYTATLPAVAGTVGLGLSIPTGTPSFTAGTGVTSVACETGYSCNNTRGTLKIVGGTATTGTIATVTFSASLSSAPACFASLNGFTSFLGIGSGAPTATAFTITAGVSVSGDTLFVNYWCQP